MNATRLNELLDRFSELRIAVLGDYFLDKYLVIDPKLAEVSVETGLTAHQVVAKRCSPGAAGTIMSNLSALGVGTLYAIGYTGRDGEGFELREGLTARRVSVEHLLEAPDRFTPTYTKPMELQEDGSEIEQNRIDIQNRTPTPKALEEALIQRLRDLVPTLDGLIVLDQVTLPNRGVVTVEVRQEIARLGDQYRNVVMVGDSRHRIGEFRNVILKPNQFEAVRAVREDVPDPLDRETVAASVQELSRRTRRPVFVTRGEQGILVYDGTKFHAVPTISVEGPIDIVGAGDSATAAITSALCAGASWTEAALLANVVASITIQQIGTTGTASPDQVRERFGEFQAAGLTDKI